MPSGLAAGKQHDGLLPRHINFDRLDEQAAHQPADLLAATRAQSADAPEKEQTHSMKHTNDTSCVALCHVNAASTAS